jgi:hypothetical protein
MKARWETGDIEQMLAGPLSFDSTDAVLIHTSLEQLATRFALGEPQGR